MSKYLVESVETYRVDSEQEAVDLIEKAKNSGNGLKMYKTSYIARKSKGEIVDEYWKVSLTKTFNDIKEPTDVITVSYEME